ncbi:hypothetical protein Bhyg_00230 [Pseudolycoriella hygida]|uniref:Uncharacterized protein n=1 Tax=Pseudolycoriella hygida TaxID=35572 RepID=A0A9Q0N7H3_9DIPT|nr:hypothetical protein Bhyg_00230 [Pseudolycoriella hygida]
MVENNLIKALIKTLINTFDKQPYGEELSEKIKDIVNIINLISRDPSSGNITKYHAHISSLDLTDQELQTILKEVKALFPEKDNRQLQEIIELPLLKRLNIQDNTKSVINQMLADRTIMSQTDFLAGRAKEAGISAGYITIDKAGGHTFILKHFHKNHKDCLLLPKKKQQQAIIDRRDAVQELIGATMYQFLLYDRAPKEALVTPDASHPNSLYIRSKFFENAISFAEFSGANSGATYLKDNNTNLKKLEGFEKAIAACHLLGEADYHAGNMMVQNGRTITKIDHGRSFIEFHQDFAAMVESTAKSFDRPGINYQNAINRGNLSFDITKYSESLNQMIHQLDERQIDVIINQKLDELKKVGFDPKGIDTLFKFEGNNWHDVGPFENFNDLGIFYKDKLKEHLNNMKEIAKSAEIISKFSNVSPKFKKGQWLKDFANSAMKDPVAYAAHHNIKIAGKKALDWASENNYKIQVCDGYIIKDTKQQQWNKNADGKWQEETIDYVEKEKNIINLDPKEYTAITKKRLKLVEDQLTSTAGKFKKEQRDIPQEEIAELYDKLLNILVKEKYLTAEECHNIKENEIYNQHIENTTKLVNLTTNNTTPVSFIDKIRYKIANFCKAISLPTLANYLVKQIPIQSLEAISSSEAAILKSTKFKELLVKPRIDTGKTDGIASSGLRTRKQGMGFAK